ncbi:zona pellucida sperm-binding protein 3 receptor-like [Amblyraja radiata]|uniref:zona pellucida sperm-binding protein 3 receptor-like n=1 Tax=Amblyraja radiata TaxID=386614 RepID=UPI0014023278|nr:zona pellucida sperm-binding protein 3 receptor-like [Amblyraja radiata]
MRRLLILVLLVAAAAADCDSPPHLENGSPVGEFLPSATFPVGTKVFYTCLAGHVLQEGSSGFVSCEENETWSSLEATCARIECDGLGEIENGFFEAPSTTFGSIAVYHCDEGYKMIGRGLRLCGPRGWTGQVPTCRVSTVSRIINEVMRQGHQLITKEESVIKSYYHLLENEREVLRMKEKVLENLEKYANENLL